MAEFVIKNPFIRFGTSASPSTYLWPFVKSLTLNFSADIIDKTASGDEYRSRIGGLKEWNATVEFNQDLGSSMVDQTLFNLIGSESSNCWLEIKMSTAAVSASNPRFYGRAFLETHQVGGAVGELAMTSANFVGDASLTRTTTG